MSRELTDKEVESCRQNIKSGVMYPYDGKEAIDVFHKASHAILGDLTKRRGIEHALLDGSQDAREDIIETMSNIISVAINDHIDEKLKEANKESLKEFKEIFIRKLYDLND